MNVYCLEEHSEDEFIIHGIFSSREKAENILKDIKRGPFCWDIEEFELDKLYES